MGATHRILGTGFVQYFWNTRDSLRQVHSVFGQLHSFSPPRVGRVVGVKHSGCHYLCHVPITRHTKGDLRWGAGPWQVLCYRGYESGCGVSCSGEPVPCSIFYKPYYRFTLQEGENNTHSGHLTTGQDCTATKEVLSFPPGNR